jgi:3-oxoacyl-[acyl-carrier-protein] synthase-3
MAVGLEAITAYLPEKIITRDEFSYLEPMMPNFQDAPLERRRCERADAVEFMGIEVAKQVLEEANLSPGDIDLVIVQTTGGHVVMPGLAAHVHHTLGMKHEAPAWNVQQCCGSWVDSCNMAWNMINANDAFDRALVMAVTAWETGGADFDKTSFAAPSCGDGAAAAIVSNQNVHGEFLAYANRTYGELYPHLIMTAAPPEHPELVEAAGAKEHFAHMVASMGFVEYIDKRGKKLPVELLPELMEKAGLTLDDLDIIVPHQVEKFFNRLWIEESKAIGIPPEKWHDTWDEYGNVGGVDVPITFAEMIGNDKIPDGSIVSLFSPGGAGHSPTILLRWLH